MVENGVEFECTFGNWSFGNRNYRGVCIHKHSDSVGNSIPRVCRLLNSNQRNCAKRHEFHHLIQLRCIEMVLVKGTDLGNFKTYLGTLQFQDMLTLGL